MKIDPEDRQAEQNIANRTQQDEREHVSHTVRWGGTGSRKRTEGVIRCVHLSLSGLPWSHTRLRSHQAGPEVGNLFPQRLHT